MTYDVPTAQRASFMQSVASLLPFHNSYLVPVLLSMGPQLLQSLSSERPVRSLSCSKTKKKSLPRELHMMCTIREGKLRSRSRRLKKDAEKV
jgi:hypothetical protein